MIPVDELEILKLDLCALINPTKKETRNTIVRHTSNGLKQNKQERSRCHCSSISEVKKVYRR